MITIETGYMCYLYLFSVRKMVPGRSVVVPMELICSYLELYLTGTMSACFGLTTYILCPASGQSIQLLIMDCTTSTRSQTCRLKPQDLAAKHHRERIYAPTYLEIVSFGPPKGKCFHFVSVFIFFHMKYMIS